MMVVIASLTSTGCSNRAAPRLVYAICLAAPCGVPSLSASSGFSSDSTVDGKTPGTSSANVSWLAAFVTNRASATAVGRLADSFEIDSPCTYSGVAPMYGDGTILPSSDGLFSSTVAMKLPPPVDQATLPSVNSWLLPR